MNKKPIAIMATVGALALGGTAIAQDAAKGGGGDHRDEMAKELAAQLDGVNANQVEQALQKIGEQHRAEHEAEMATAIAKNLDGVSADQVKAALSAFHDQNAPAEGGNARPERPDPDKLATFLADELGTDKDAVSSALKQAHPDGDRGGDRPGGDRGPDRGEGHRGPGGPGFGPPPSA